MLPDGGIALARLAAVSVKIDVWVLAVVEAVKGRGQETGGYQAGSTCSNILRNNKYIQDKFNDNLYPCLAVL